MGRKLMNHRQQYRFERLVCYQIVKGSNWWYDWRVNWMLFRYRDASRYYVLLHFEMPEKLLKIVYDELGRKGINEAMRIAGYDDM